MSHPQLSWQEEEATAKEDHEEQQPQEASLLLSSQEEDDDHHGRRLQEDNEEDENERGGDEEGEDKEVTRYHHEFTQEELEQLLYQSDEASYPVKDYHYMKPEWQTPDAVVSGPIPKGTVAPKAKNVDLRQNAKDTGERTEVDLSSAKKKNGTNVEEEDMVPLELDDTMEGAVIVEFYAPWCGHCIHFKPEYIDMARELTRRSIGIPIHVYGVSCQLYPEICRYYEIGGFPVVQGWRVGENIQEKGYELNPPGYQMTIDVVAKILDLTLASDPQATKKEEDSDAELTPEQKRELERKQAEAGRKAAFTKRDWQEYPSVLNDRYSDAAVSLAFVLKTSVFLQPMTDRRAQALLEFLQLLDWTTPPSWLPRRGLVRDLLDNLGDVLNGGSTLMTELVQRHQMVHVEDGHWGDVNLKSRIKGHKRGLGVDVPHAKKAPANEEEELEIYLENNQWTDACTHSQQQMNGFTCGLWELFHIITVGASFPVHRVYGIRSGYPTDSKTIATILNQFIQDYLGCDVCRWHFRDMFDNCGHDHCKRLSNAAPELASGKTEDEQVEMGQALALWLWEVHNDVNVRLMREAAERDHRNITKGETLAAVFPSKVQCPKCWKNDALTLYDQDEVFAFLQDRYWPEKEQIYESSFKTVLRRELGETNRVNGFVENWLIMIAPVCLVVALLLRKVLEARADYNRKKL